MANWLNVLRSHRKALTDRVRSIGQSKVARDAGLTEMMVSRFVRGVGGDDAATMYKIAYAVGAAVALAGECVTPSNKRPGRAARTSGPVAREHGAPETRKNANAHNEARSVSAVSKSGAKAAKATGQSQAKARPAKPSHDNARTRPNATVKTVASSKKPAGGRGDVLASPDAAVAVLPERRPIPALHTANKPVNGKRAGVARPLRGVPSVSPASGQARSASAPPTGPTTGDAATAGGFVPLGVSDLQP